ncbi:hypothetical protein EIP91_001552 [Steccherinum ochraceum]|uniref:Uncharacterized protein n=1 Tax=Steccherinum ochraceum TaxID=92696 RepID=A0A4R0RG97_9APHY|nr:hypothetical protein EIP91_001552 [Steccherinum ochraceum]
MRYAIILACALAVATSSGMAVPLHEFQAREVDQDALVARDILQAIHARELNTLDARTDELNFFVKRGSHKSTPRPSGGGGGAASGSGNARDSPAPSYHSTQRPPSYRSTASADYNNQDARRAAQRLPPYGAQGNRDGGPVPGQRAQPAHASSNAAGGSRGGAARPPAASNSRQHQSAIDAAFRGYNDSPSSSRSGSRGAGR